MHLEVDATLSNFCVFPFTHEASRSRRSSLLLELHRSLDFVFFFVFFGALQKLPGTVRDVPQDVSEHYCKFKSFLVFPITNMSWGRRWLWSPPQQLFMCLNSQALKLYFTYISFPVYL